MLKVKWILSRTIAVSVSEQLMDAPTGTPVAKCFTEAQFDIGVATSD